MITLTKEYINRIYKCYLLTGKLDENSSIINCIKYMDSLNINNKDVELVKFDSQTLSFYGNQFMYNNDSKYLSITNSSIITYIKNELENIVSIQNFFSWYF